MFVGIYGTGREKLAKNIELAMKDNGLERIFYKTTDTNAEGYEVLTVKDFLSRENTGELIHCRPLGNFKYGISNKELERAWRTRRIYFMTIASVDALQTQRFFKTRGMLHLTEWIYVKGEDEVDNYKIATLTLDKTRPEENLKRALMRMRTLFTTGAPV